MSTSSSVPPNPDQLSPLPGVQRHITTNDPSTGLAKFHSSTPGDWKTFSPSMAFNVIYTTSVSPPSLSDETDINTHDSLMSSGKLGLVNPHGSVCRMVDFGPSTDEEHSKHIMHRTQSLDYGIVISGEIECVLDSGETRLMRQGDIAVQRGTMHAWRNASSTNWARMAFVLIESEKIVLEGGKELGMDLEAAPEHARAILRGQQ
ncbi:MAG: hypothetical protein Q9190_000766 [Brigantiaea leucoxantha]